MMEIFILTNLLICTYADTKRNAYCLENLSVFQSVDIASMGDFTAECHEQTVLFLINPNKARLFEASFFCGGGSVTYFIFQEELI